LIRFSAFWLRARRFALNAVSIFHVTFSSVLKADRLQAREAFELNCGVESQRIAL
jgi:hypothetical protein